MKRFLFQTSVENAEGSQTWYVDAKNETEALQKYSNGDCDIYASEVDVTSIGQPELAGETTLDDFGDFRPTQPKEHLPNMSEINRTIAYSAAATLHELGYEWKDGGWIAQQKEPEQEPVAWSDSEEYGHIKWKSDWAIPDGTPLYTTPPQPKEPEQEPVAVAHMAIRTLRLGMKHQPREKIDAFVQAICDLEVFAEKYTTPPQRKPLTDGLPCCGYTDATAIKWNEFNHAVQCHNCGHTYTQTSNKPLTLDYIDQHIGADEGDREAVVALVREVEAAHGIKE